MHRLVMRATLALVTMSCNYAPAVFYPGYALETYVKTQYSTSIQHHGLPGVLTLLASTLQQKPSSAGDPYLELVSSLSAGVVTKFDLTQQQTPC
jgi:hypothetical protein